MENKIEVGQRFGKLVVIGIASKRKYIQYYYVKCDCGKKGKEVAGTALHFGAITNCGCEKGGDIVKNPLIKHPLHRVWSDMIQRCENPKRVSYHLYGKRGIKVCEEWRKNYMAFYAWSVKNGYKVEKMPSGRNRYSLDRINPNGDYCPENCRWIDYRDQSNKRKDLPIEYKGETKLAKEWVKQFQGTIPFFYYLLNEGMSELEAIKYIENL
jgi:hypothetical protein